MYTRAEKYGDGLFETMRVKDGIIYLWDLHWQRLSAGAALIGLEFEAQTKGYLYSQVISSVNTDTVCRARLTIYRSGAGLYTPQESKFEFFVEASELKTSAFSLTPKGLTLGVYNQQPVGNPPLANMKTINSLPYIMAANWRKSVGLDDVVMVNAKGNVAEGGSSNLFIQKDGQWSTPALSEGCINGVIRRALLNQFDIQETIITIGTLLEADSIVLSNSISGIRWVGSVKHENQSFVFEAPNTNDWIEYLNGLW